MDPNPPSEQADFQELAVAPASDSKFSFTGLGCVLLAGAWACLLIVEGTRINLNIPMYGDSGRGHVAPPSKSVLAWFFGLAAVQVVLFVLGISAVLHRQRAQAMKWATALIGAIFLMYAAMLTLCAPSGMR